MQAIWKYPLPPIGVCNMEMPAKAKVLCVQVQGGMPCLWALVDVDELKSIREFVTYGTGHVHIAISGKYVGTYQLDNGGLVFHVFEKER
jgi:hypothetical protein